MLNLYLHHKLQDNEEMKTQLREISSMDLYDLCQAFVVKCTPLKALRRMWDLTNTSCMQEASLGLSVRYLFQTRILCLINSGIFH